MGLFKIIGYCLLLVLIVGALLFFGIVRVDGDYLSINLKTKSVDNSSLVKVFNDSLDNSSDVVLVNESNSSGS